MTPVPGMTYDVIIAGAGPVGLFLASELRLRDPQLSVLILEQAADPHSPLKGLPFGMRGLWGPSVEAFYRRGLLAQIAAQPQPQNVPRHIASAAMTPGKPGQLSGPAGHFAGIQFDHAHIDTARWPERLPGPSAIQLGASMEHIEAVLAAHALAAGVALRRGQAVTGVEQAADEVTVRTAEHTFRARYLVGCDGGRSTVRKLAGFSFVGTEPEFTGYSVHVELADPEQLGMGRQATPTGNYTQAQPGFIGMTDFDGGAHHRAELTLAHVQSVLRRVSNTDVTVTALHLAATWTDRSFQATTYRQGRVLLAGDAAHIHSPLGGQGLNLGLGDAMNLGWKLAATLRGAAPAGLLDSYTAERHPIGARILDWTRAQVVAMRPDRSSRALAAVLRDLIATRDGATYFADRVWNVSLRYEPAAPAHPLVGRSCPDFALADGTRLGELLRGGQGVLLDFTPQHALQPLATRWGDQVRYVATTATDPLGTTAVLVRPDGFVAWATASAPDVDQLTAAAARWFS